MNLKYLFLILQAFLFIPFYVSADNSVPWVGSTLDGSPCMGTLHGVGPFDYTDEKLRKDPTKLAIVEGRHFTSDVENLIKGETSTTPEGDLNYTLTSWPNHHRALISIINYQLKIKNKLMPGKLNSPPECYLQRAIYFSPKDAVIYSLYGYYLHKVNKLENSIKYYERAMELSPDNSKISYSYSLLLINLKRYDEAVKYAKIAYQDSHAPKGLKQKLQKLQMWSDSEPTAEKEITSVQQ